MSVGMITVMLFLGLMMYFIYLVARLTKNAALREMEDMIRERELLAQNSIEGSEGDRSEEDIAVITAALAAYEAERGARV